MVCDLWFYSPLFQNSNDGNFLSLYSITSASFSMLLYLFVLDRHWLTNAVGLSMLLPGVVCHSRREFT